MHAFLSDECKNFTEEAEAEAKTGDHTITAERWKSAGFCYSDTKDFSKASQCFLNSAEESIKGKDKTGASDSFLCATIILLRSGNKEEASKAVKLADTKGLGGTDNIKLGKELIKVIEGGNKKAKQEIYAKFSYLIEDNYWLRKTLDKMGITAPPE